MRPFFCLRAIGEGAGNEKPSKARQGKDMGESKSDGGGFGLIILLVAMVMSCPSEKDHRKAIKDALVKEAVEAGEESDFDRRAALPSLLPLAVKAEVINQKGKYTNIGLVSWMTANGELCSIGAFNHVWYIK